MARERFSDEGIRTLAQVYIYLLCGAEKSPHGKHAIKQTLAEYSKQHDNEDKIPYFNPTQELKKSNGTFYTLKDFNDLLINHRGLMGIKHTKPLTGDQLPNVGGILSIKGFVETFNSEINKLRNGKGKFVFDKNIFNKNIEAISAARISDKRLFDLDTKEKTGLGFLIKSILEANNISKPENETLKTNSESYRIFLIDSQKKDRELCKKQKNILTNNLVLDYTKEFLGAVFGIFHQIAANAKKEKQIKLGKEYHWKNEPKFEPLEKPITPTTMITHKAEIVGNELKHGVNETVEKVAIVWRKRFTTRDKKNTDPNTPSIK